MEKSFVGRYSICSVVDGRIDQSVEATGSLSCFGRDDTSFQRCLFTIVDIGDLHLVFWIRQNHRRIAHQAEVELVVVGTQRLLGFLQDVSKPITAAIGFPVEKASCYCCIEREVLLGIYYSHRRDKSYCPAIVVEQESFTHRFVIAVPS